MCLVCGCVRFSFFVCLFVFLKQIIWLQVSDKFCLTNKTIMSQQGFVNCRVSPQRKRTAGTSEEQLSMSSLETDLERRGWEGVGMCRGGLVDTSGKGYWRRRKKGPPQRRLMGVLKEDVWLARIKNNYDTPHILIVIVGWIWILPTYTYQSLWRYSLHRI